MSMLVRFSPPSMTVDQYDAILERIYKECIHPDLGLELQLCFGSGSQMKVFLLFDSKEHLEAFGAKIGSVLSEMGIDPGEPEVIELHNVIRRNSQSLKKLNFTNISFVEFNPFDCSLEYGHKIDELM